MFKPARMLSISVLALVLLVLSVSPSVRFQRVLAPASAEIVLAQEPPPTVEVDSKGNFIVPEWFEIHEDYGVANSNENIVRENRQGLVRTENSFFDITKEYRLENDKLHVIERITPKSGNYQNGNLNLKIRFKKGFDYYYAPYSWSMGSEATGVVIQKNERQQIIGQYLGAESNVGARPTYALLAGGQGALVIYEISVGGIPVQKYPSIVSGDLAEMAFPLFDWGFFLANPEQEEPSTVWRESKFPPEGVVVTYSIQLLPPLPFEELRGRATQLYWNEIKTLYSETFSRTMPSGEGFENAAFVTIIGAWYEYYDLYIGRIRQWREIFDNKGLSSKDIYIWIQLWDDKYAGWGDFPLNTVEVKNFFQKLKQIHNVKVGLYVNAWLASENSEVRKSHPEWFDGYAWELSDTGEFSYHGILPMWGTHLADGVGKIFDAYQLDFIFLDHDYFPPFNLGSFDQQKKFYENLKEEIHNHDGKLLCNGFGNPYCDAGFLEVKVGKNEDEEKQLLDMDFLEKVSGPQVGWYDDLLTEKARERFFAQFAGDERFVPAFPVFLGQVSYPILTEQFVKPYATILASRTVIPGDANGDSVVNDVDLDLLKQDYLGTPAHNTDFNGDGRVDCEDFAILQSNYSAE